MSVWYIYLFVCVKDYNYFLTYIFICLLVHHFVQLHFSWLRKKRCYQHFSRTNQVIRLGCLYIEIKLSTEELNFLRICKLKHLATQNFSANLRLKQKNVIKWRKGLKKLSSPFSKKYCNFLYSILCRDPYGPLCKISASYIKIDFV